MIRTRFALPADVIPLEDFVTNPGSEIREIFQCKIDADGRKELVKVGQENIQEYIDSFASSCDLRIILQRLSAGDTSVLRSGAMYGDFTNLPRTFAEALQLVKDGESYFGSLPADVRIKFDNSFEQWFSSAGSASWFESMGYNPMPVNSPPAPQATAVTDSEDN